MLFLYTSLVDKKRKYFMELTLSYFLMISKTNIVLNIKLPNIKKFFLHFTSLGNDAVVNNLTN